MLVWLSRRGILLVKYFNFLIYNENMMTKLL